MSNKDNSAETAADVQPALMSGFTILQIISWTNAEIAKCREKLEVEPSGRVVAYLQGKIPGCKFAIKSIREIFGLTEEQFANLEPPVDMSKLSHEQILGAEIDMNKLKEENDLWIKFLSAIEEKAEGMKNFLLKEAKKSRELDECQGKYQGMVVFEKVFSTIHEQASFWKSSIFRKSDAGGDENSDARNANDELPALLPPGLPPPDDENEPPSEDYEESGERSFEDLPEEGEVIGEEDPNLGDSESGNDDD